MGAGIVGSATALELTRRGKRVVLVDRFALGHSRGSSHGPTRAFRLSYEDAMYAELGIQALEDWRRLERDLGTELLDRCGGLDIGKDALACADAMSSAGVVCERIEPADVLKRFGVIVGEDEPCIWQPDAAVIDAASSLEGQLTLAAQAGCEIKEEAQVLSINIGEHAATVSTSAGDIDCADVVIAAGPWVRPVAAQAGFDVEVFVTKEQVTYFDGLEPAMPIVIDRSASPARYLVPKRFAAPGARTGLHHARVVVDPEEGPFEADEEVADGLGDWLAQRASSPTSRGFKKLSSEPCMYTNTRDEDFVISRKSRALVVSACSGHGFKFAPRIARAAADVIDGLDPDLPGRLGDWWR
ncbi:MAG: FAD-dependent oxidoreductase [Actinobacteria bacterium]|nr:FAD-dependent oxidoreductase [Actinomycetota bacterium]